MSPRRLMAIWVLAAGLMALEAKAAEPIGPYTLEEAIQTALDRHPRIAGAKANEVATVDRVDEANAGWLPDVGVSAQVNRSTGNTPPGTFFYTTGIPPVSGAPRGRTLDSGAWQTGVGIWASWDAMSFVRQVAAVDLALAGTREAHARVDAQRLEIAYAAADAFLRVLEAEQAAIAARANVERAEVLVTTVKPLVDQSLRPGVDAARADSELAVARTELVRSELARDVERARLAEAMGLVGGDVRVIPGRLLDPVRPARPPTADPRQHPSVREADGAVARAAQVTRVVKLEYVPRLELAASLWLRGSGLFDSPGQGFVPDIPNWAAGAIFSYSFLDIPSIRARARAAAAEQSVATARRNELVLAIAAQLREGSALLEGALRVAQNTPIALASARAAEQQATARYKAGLIPLVEVAEAEHLLTRAEIDDALARLEVRRALLVLARASGDLGPFLAQARAGGV